MHIIEMKHYYYCPLGVRRGVRRAAPSPQVPAQPFLPGFQEHPRARSCGGSQPLHRHAEGGLC